MTFWILLVLALVMTVISLRWRNILFSLAGTLGWLALWMYNLNSPPSGITIGTPNHEILIYAFIIMAIAVMMLYFINGKRGYTGYPKSAKEQAEYDREVKSSGRTPNGMTEMTNEEYRARVRRALHQNRNRR